MKINYRNLLLCSVIFFLHQMLIAQSCQVSFALYGSEEGVERGYCLASSLDGNHVYLAGTKGDSVILMKYATSGLLTWTRAFDVVQGVPDHPYGLVVDSDGMLVFSGIAGSVQDGGTVFIVKYNPETNQTIWAKEIIRAVKNYNLGVIELGPGGNYLMSNNIDIPNDAELICFDRNTGEYIPEFAKQYPFTGGSQSIYDFVYTEGQLYASGRFTDGNGFSDMHSVVMKINTANGLIDWIKFGHKPPALSSRLYAVDICLGDDHLYTVIVGDQSGSSITNTKLFVQKNTLDGEVVWIKQYELPGTNDWVDEIIHSHDGLVVMARNRVSPSDIILFKLDYDGDVMWSKKFDIATNDNGVFLGTAMSQLIEADNKLFLTGYAEENGKVDLIFIRTDLEGNIAGNCTYTDTLIIPVTNITDTTYYAAEISPFTIVPNIIDHTLGGAIESSIQSEPVCFADTADFTSVVAEICAGSSFEGYQSSGIYIDTFANTQGCDSIRTLDLTVLQAFEEEISVSICAGEEYEGYAETGVYADTLTSVNGCDSIRSLRLLVYDCQPVIYYDLDLCRSYMFDGSIMDYSEFDPAYPNALACATVEATNIYRTPPAENKHSCTPGLEGSVAMCVSSLASCTYAPGNAASIVFEFTITPDADSSVAFNKLTFFEKAPTMYSWIDGPSGVNNYPRFYGIRILKNGVQIFEQHDIATAQDWELQQYDFNTIEAFTIAEATTFTIELLPYCPIGNGADVSAWDLENVRVYASCTPSIPDPFNIGGVISLYDGRPLNNINVTLSPWLQNGNGMVVQTNQTGQYNFSPVEAATAYSVSAHYDLDDLNGVSTFDIILLQKHLLGIQPLTTLDQLVAADINHNDRTDVLDLLDLRKTLLGIYPSFPNNTSWRFGSLNTDWTSLHISDLKEQYDIESLNASVENLHFTGIKIGDINRDIRLSNLQEEIINRNPIAKELKVSITQAENADEVILSFYNTSALDVTGFQIAFQHLMAQDAEILPGAIAIQHENYYVDDQEIARISWSIAKAQHIPENTLLFRVKSSKHRIGNGSGVLQLRNEILTAEMYAENEIFPISISIDQNDNSLHQQTQIVVRPNPFDQHFVLEFYAHKEELARIQLFNSTGMLLFATERMVQAGSQEMLISLDDLSGNHEILFCRLTLENGSVTKGIIHHNSRK